jgi:hypothetical protein
LIPHAGFAGRWKNGKRWQCDADTILVMPDCRIFAKDWRQPEGRAERWPAGENAAAENEGLEND